MFLGTAWEVTALWYAARHPDSIDGVMLVAPGIIVKALSTRKAAIQLSFANLFVPRRMLDVSRTSFVEGRDPGIIKLLLQDPLETYKLSCRYLANIRKTLVGRALENASHIEKPTLILQGEADVTAMSYGARRLYESLGTKDKSLQTIPDADHRFYDMFSPVPLPTKYDPTKTERLFSIIKDWLRARARSQSSSAA